MDILYVIGSGSKWSNNEIRFSLRSVEKFGKNVGRIFVCGINPGILSDEVIMVPCGDPYDCAHKNIMHKIDHAIKNTDISDEFILASDDHFYVKPVDFDKMTVYKHECFGKVLPDRVLREGDNYFYSLVETRKLLEDAGLPIYETNPHCGKPMSRDVWQKTAALRVAAMELPHGGEANCIVGNYMIAHGAKPVLYRDVKISDFESPADLERQIGDSHCFSIFDSAVRCGLEQYLLRLFPNPSKYEYVAPASSITPNQPRRVAYTVRKGAAIITKYKYIYD